MLLKKARKPNQKQPSPAKHGRLEFATHVINTTLNIAVLTVAAVVLHHVVGWAEGQGLPWLVVFSLKTLEYTAYAMDVLLSAHAIIKTAIKGLKE